MSRAPWGCFVVVVVVAVAGGGGGFVLVERFHAVKAELGYSGKHTVSPGRRCAKLTSHDDLLDSPCKLHGLMPGERNWSTDHLGGSDESTCESATALLRGLLLSLSVTGVLIMEIQDKAERVKVQ
uniref:Uncharacterized protein n=1 Tax=Oryza brachyantha TaxID=4533 RepID=J3M873_ORYBR